MTFQVGNQLARKKPAFEAVDDAAIPAGAGLSITTMTIDQAMPTIRPFSQGDITTHAPWLVGKLRAWYPHLNEANIVGWLRAWMGNNEYLFLRGEQSAGLATIYREPMDSAPYVREVWTAFLPGAEAEALGILAAYVKWSKMQGAPRFQLAQHSDLTPTMARDVYKRLIVHQVQSVDLTRV